MDSNFRFRTREAADLSFRFLSMSPKLSAFSSAEIHLARGRRFEIPGPAGPMGRAPDHWETPSPRPNGLMARPGTESSNPSPSSEESGANLTFIRAHRSAGLLDHRPEILIKLAARLSKGRRRLSFCYEAGPCGYGLHRLLTGCGHDRVVVAPR
jgi:hypothetical protein